MQTYFTLQQLKDDPHLEESDRIIRSCQHFGFCTATCPTYVLLGDENDGPRGRIDLIRVMLERGGAPSETTVAHIDRCLSCLACMTTCAVRVDYMHLVDHARAHIERHFRRPWSERLFRWILANVLPHPRIFRAALAAARLARPFGGLLPKRLANLLAMSPGQVLGAGQEPRPGVHSAQGPRRYRVLLLAGCVQPVLAPSINAATIRVLTRHGCDVVIPPSSGCCGALTLHMGREQDALQSARHNIDAWTKEMEEGPVDAIIVNASGCGTTVKDYGHLFRNDARYGERAARISSIAFDVSEFLDRIGLQRPASAERYAVAYHHACSLRNGQRVTEAPLRLLAAAGYVTREVPEAQMCCGSAGAYNMLQPHIAGQLGPRKAGHVESTGASVLALGNIGCMMQLRRYLTLPVVHTVELLDWATGGPRPPALEGVELAAAPPITELAETATGIW